ncbi:hypothetical protein NOF04DRAFT_5692 [Fusarium oxysporum II5]|uniref:Uncharacterized protein n=3 Tax=Fusarium oxysporum species complex TaxID=171631 RepID=N1S7I4_FUSC4|nr:uncharacterized protein FOIG_08988 [Fusarium odoratissimum NRRL 54006]EMT70545.1 hypothetical protein FOC4_g10009008 [Fusarium odoratissimum]EXL99109.1 hypothetical protein FOIG_08988 [Fusarium odoratissimum NRRL 54006]KAK2130347.1 hypothetical protein NOF04DRAFT_5692 [Fusarium oxysporum II5]TXC01629.1 hypothetical protein FocTR4_00009274 [Fusarium oxysporum f. sp. cubense]
MSSTTNFPSAWATIGRSLTTPNPTLQTATGNSNIAMSQTTFQAASSIIKRWRDFDLGNLHEPYGDLLDNYNVPVVVDEQSSVPATNITDLKKALTGHIVHRLRQPIATGVTLLASRCGEARRDVTVLTDEPLAHRRRSALSFVTSDGERLAVSCAYTSNQWTSRELEDSESSQSYPLLRLATYCHDAGTRYGFIFSDHELIVSRVSGTSFSCLIEWQSIPWEAAGPGVLTVNLSLFLMVMMALHNSHRPILRHLQPFPINFWYRFQNIDGDWVNRHHLSRREVFHHLPGAITELPNGVPFEDAHITE